jgi:plasmid stability protein
MSDLLIRGLDPKLKRRLKESAMRNNRTLSDEAKLLLQRALATGGERRKLGSEMLNLVPPKYRGDDLVFEIPGDVSVPPDFE